MSLRLKGIAGSPGIAIGPLSRVLLRGAQNASAQLTGDAALQAFAAAKARLGEQLRLLSDELRAEGKPAEAAVFDAHILLAGDPTLAIEVERRVRQESQPLHQAIREATTAFAETLSSLADDYLRERAADIRAVGEQLLDQLGSSTLSTEIPAGAIIVADELTPAQTALLRRARIAGIATAGGTATGHVAILARAMGLPAAVGLGAGLLDVADQLQAVLAADEGLLIVEPEPQELQEYRRRAEQQRRSEERRKALSAQPVQTSDGHSISLWANIGHPDEAQRAVEFGARGIGLFRTEFLFLDRQHPPNEEEQYQAYAGVVRALAGLPVSIRTLDVGGDKPLPYLPQLAEPNPFLGTRGIRISMQRPELFLVQLRALLRAAAEGNLRVMLPMVSTVEDIAWAREQLAAAAQDLQQAGVACNADVPLGIMVETPAAALALDLLAPHVRFCSIGSNDLAQYVLAVDRTSTRLSERYSDDSPAVFRMIRLAVQSARRLGLEISICGQLAGEPEASIRLAGLGLEKLSMAPGSLPAVAEALRGVSMAQARRQAKAACRR